MRNSRIRLGAALLALPLWLAAPAPAEGAGRCTASSQCSSAQYCQAGQCVSKQAIGLPCTADAACTTGKCSQGFCRCFDDAQCSGALDFCNEKTGACVACTSSAHCASNEACSGGACVAKLPNGAPCNAGAACASGNCAQGLCGCANDAQCSGALDFCDEATGACVECTSSAHCSSNEACSGGACVAKLPIGAPCNAGAVCASGSCAQGVCGCANDTQCSGALDFCNESTGACVECTSSAHCASNAFCDGGACIAKRPPGSPCTSSAVCATGACARGLCR